MPHGSEQPLPERRRSTRERWLLLGLLLLALCAGVGLGLVLSAHFEPARAIAAATTAAAPCPYQDAVVSLCSPPIERDWAPAALAAPIVTASQPPRRAARPPHAVAVRGTSDRGASDREASDHGGKARALGPDLHEALQLLRAAQQALRAADTARALSVLAEMERRTPDLLVAEREVTRALAHCAAQDVDSARRTAAGLRESGAASVYEHRLAESCVGPGPTPASLLEEMRRRALN